MIDCWIHNNKCLEEPPEGYFGFIYLITNTLDGKIYVGKKQFTHRKTTRVSKRVKKATGTRKRKNVTNVDSGWKDYYGSCMELKAALSVIDKKHFKREVLMFCKSKAELTYYEMQYQVDMKVMFVPSYNGWIGGKVFKSTLLKTIK